MGRTFHPDKRRTFTSLIYTRLKILRAISVPRKTRISAANCRGNLSIGDAVEKGGKRK